MSQLVQHHKPIADAIINGVITDYIHINDRALHYGDGLFETILLYKNKLYYWQQHYQRLNASADRLDICCPTQKLLLADIRKLIEQHSQKRSLSSNSCYVIKIILSRGNGERGYRYPENVKVKRIVTCSPLDAEYSTLVTELLSYGNLYLCQHQVSINQSLAGIKHLNRLENVLAHNEWKNRKDKKYIDGVMLNANKHVIECTMSNLFAVAGNRLITPDLRASGINGILRMQLIQIAEQESLDVLECDISLGELSKTHEIFICNSVFGLKSVTNFHGKQYGPASICAQLFQKLISSKEDYLYEIQI